jgi:hypothetical protein
MAVHVLRHDNEDEQYSGVIEKLIGSCALLG